MVDYNKSTFKDISELALEAPLPLLYATPFNFNVRQASFKLKCSPKSRLKSKYRRGTKRLYLYDICYVKN